MPPKGKAGNREQMWQKKPNFDNEHSSKTQSVEATAAEFDLNRVSVLTIAEKNERAHVSPLHLKHGSVLPYKALKHCQKAVWKPKSDGLVNGAMMARVKNASVEAVIDQRNGAEDTALEKSALGLSKLFKGSLLDSTMANPTCSYSRVNPALYPKFKSEKLDQERRGDYRDQRWQRKPDVDFMDLSMNQPVTETAAKDDISKTGVPTILEKNERGYVSSLSPRIESFLPNNACMGFEQRVWKPKSDGIENDAEMFEAEAVAVEVEDVAVGVEDVAVGVEVVDVEAEGVDVEVENVAVVAVDKAEVVAVEVENVAVGVEDVDVEAESVDVEAENVAVKVENVAVEVENVAVVAVDNQGNAAEAATLEKSDHGFSMLSKITISENHTMANSTYSHAQVKAAFYPRSEVGMSDQEIRMQMIEMVSKGLATLEVSLKHSGFLFTYAGHKGGAYAKSTFGNIYTAVGVFILGRVFCEAWGTEARKKQAEFNCFLERGQICISMELVTVVLGDHGQRPQEDYGVVTAVTELGNGKPKFYSTPDIISFCQKWRLPTNYVWLFSTRKSVTTFFASYDVLHEEGTTTSVCKVLDQVADLSMPGSKDYVKVQGEIVEGLEVRVVNHETLVHMEKVLRNFRPPSLEVDVGVGPSLREICAANRSDEWQLIKALLHSAGKSFCPDYSDWFETEPSDEYTRKADQSYILKFLEAHPTNFCTAKLQEMICLMKENRYAFKLQFYHNFSKMASLSSDKLYLKMTFDASSDSAFQGYQQQMRCKPGLWPLYRGLFVDVNLFKANKDNAVDIVESSSNSVQNVGNGSSASGNDGLADEDAYMMIELNFLPYKLRTSLIRDGLSILFKDGRAAYKAYYLRQMKAWGTSSEKQWALSKMLDEWSFFVPKKYVHQQLSPSMYLSEAEPFLEQYAKRSQENKALVRSAGNLVTSEDFLAIAEDGTEFGYAGTVARADDFFSIVEDGMAEEGDIAKFQKLALAASTPSVKNEVPKKECLIIFFPGMPGSSKSGLCREINSPDGLGDGRQVHCLMGDHLKGIGKNYWQELADECRRKPHSIILADKNAPNEETWKIFEKICSNTKASAIPVVPDSEGTNSNPFSLDALAVFMFRVFQRDYHTGNLDKASPKAGYVLLLFYHIHDGKSRKEFERELVQRFGYLVKTPLLKSERSPMPEAIRSTLKEGINLYKLHNNRHAWSRLDSLEGSYSKEWVEWEKKLQKIILENSEYLDNIQVPFKDRVKQVKEQLRTIATGEHTKRSSENRKFGTISFAAVSLPVADIQSLLDNLAKHNPGVEAFLRKKHIEQSLRNTHVILAHKRSHGVVDVANYGPFLQQMVSVDLTALLFSEKVAALEACLGSIDGEKITSKYEWPHVAVWTGEGTAEEEANILPQLVSEDKATQIDINPPISLLGTLGFY